MSIPQTLIRQFFQLLLFLPVLYFCGKSPTEKPIPVSLSFTANSSALLSGQLVRKKAPPALLSLKAHIPKIDLLLAKIESNRLVPNPLKDPDGLEVEPFSPLLKKAIVVSRVMKVLGQVWLKTPYGEKVDKVTSGSILEDGDIINTGDNSAASMILADGNWLEIGSKSSMGMDGADELLTLLLYYGSAHLLAISTPAVAIPPELSLITPNCLVQSAAGEIFIYLALDGSTRIGIRGGAARLQSENRVVSLSMNEATDIQPGTEPDPVEQLNDFEPWMEQALTWLNQKNKAPQVNISAVVAAGKTAVEKRLEKLENAYANVIYLYRTLYPLRKKLNSLRLEGGKPFTAGREKLALTYARLLQWANRLNWLLHSSRILSSNLTILDKGFKKHQGGYRHRINQWKKKNKEAFANYVLPNRALYRRLLISAQVDSVNGPEKIAIKNHYEYKIGQIRTEKLLNTTVSPYFTR